MGQAGRVSGSAGRQGNARRSIVNGVSGVGRGSPGAISAAGGGGGTTAASRRRSVSGGGSGHSGTVPVTTLAPGSSSTSVSCKLVPFQKHTAPGAAAHAASQSGGPPLHSSYAPFGTTPAAGGGGGGTVAAAAAGVGGAGHQHPSSNNHHHHHQHHHHHHHHNTNNGNHIQFHHSSSGLSRNHHHHHHHHHNNNHNNATTNTTFTNNSKADVHSTSTSTGLSSSTTSYASHTTASHRRRSSANTKHATGQAGGHHGSSSGSGLSRAGAPHSVGLSVAVGGSATPSWLVSAGGSPGVTGSGAQSAGAGGVGELPAAVLEAHGPPSGMVWPVGAGLGGNKSVRSVMGTTTVATSVAGMSNASPSSGSISHDSHRLSSLTSPSSFQTSSTIHAPGSSGPLNGHMAPTLGHIKPGQYGHSTTPTPTTTPTNTTGPTTTPTTTTSLTSPSSHSKHSGSKQTSARLGSAVLPRNKVLVAEALGKRRIERHPLRYTWVCWFMYRHPGERIVNYEQGIRRVAAFSSIEDFWAVFSHLRRPNELPTISDYHLFRQGVRPVWEDETNIKGGKWIVRLRKGLARRYWESLVLAVIGDQFGESICGVVLSIRNSEDILSLWNHDASNGPLNLRIRDTIRKVLVLPTESVMEYKCHASALKDQSSFRNTDVFR